MEISDRADWQQFEVIAKWLELDYQAILVNQLDGLDTRYWDFHID
jgi:hypothetical protein